MRRFVMLLIGMALVAAACTSGDDDAGEGDVPTTTSAATSSSATTGVDVVTLDSGEIQLISTLRTFDECEALLDHIRTEALERVGAYGLEGDGWYGPGIPELRGGVDLDTAAEEGEAPADAAVAGANGGDDAGGAELVEGVDFSGTNVQELGVDEADIVKTDGEQIYVVAGDQLVIVDAASATVSATVDVAAGWSKELFLAGDQVLLVSRGDTYENPLGATRLTGEIAPDQIEYVADTTVIQRISVGLTPRVLETLRVEGSYLSARAVDGVARILVSSNPQWQLPFVFPQTEAGEERAAEANREVVAETTLEDWLPAYDLSRDGQVVVEGLLPDCGAVHAPTEFSGFGMLNVVSVPVAGDIDPAATTSVMAPGEIVYASTEGLYVATTNWIDAQLIEDEQDWDELWANRRTNIHRFELTDTGTAYAGSGSVAGTVRNQFSMSEHDGHLRVVTTTGEPWNESSVSWVRVLRPEGDELVEVGSVGDIGNGEDVQSVRFVGDVGYVVTFRQIDPFYTVDLADPTNPTVLGELKIPGFSSYLHPIGDGLVMGVGSDADQEGRVTGAKVSLFDVSDLTAPQEVAVWTAPDGWNDVGWEHRSFLWWEPEQIAVIPVQVWSDNWAGAVVLQVQGDQLVEIGRIDHADPDAAEPGTTPCDTLTIDDLGGSDPASFETELQYLLDDGYGLVLRCGDDDPATAVGYSCVEEPYFVEEAERLGLSIPEGERLVICWPDDQPDTIVRSLVIGGDLWTLSFPWGDTNQPGGLRSHSLPDLAPGARLILA